MALDSETIAAVATPAGRGGVGIVRVSGVAAVEIAEKMIGFTPTARYAHYTPFWTEDSELIDQGIALFFSGPHSYTGEDVLELQGHGGPLVLDRLLQRVVELGARMAHPGEFSERAFLNNKIDLIQAEAIQQLIHAQSEQAMRAALRSLQGEFSGRVNDIVNNTIHLRMYVEAAIDFPEEEIDFLQDSHVQNELNSITQSVTSLLAHAENGVLLQDGVKVVILGKPNAGKSSLLNTLTGEQTAIVTEIPGTTRDVIRAQIRLGGLPVNIVDTAGLRFSDDIIEQEGIRRAEKELSSADVVMVIIDGNEEKNWNPEVLFPEWLARVPDSTAVLTVINKADLLTHSLQLNPNQILVSAKTAMGIEGLVGKLHQIVGFANNGETDIIARRRHIQALQQALSHLKQANQCSEQGDGELIAEELRLAQDQLSILTGRFTSDDLLGKIFSEFCIGK